jgi:hypothetical protein
MRYGTYDATRGLTIAAAAGVAGLLLWAATQVGQTTTPRFWAEMGIVAGAGLVLALAHALGSWTKGLRMRISPGTFLLGFVPVLVCVGWILMATQPGKGWHEGQVVTWSHNAGLMGVVHALGLWHGVLAFGFGLVLGMSFDSVPAVAPAAAEAAATGAPATAGGLRRSRRGVPVRPGRPAAPPVAMDRRAADEPMTAERQAAASDGRTATPATRGEPVAAGDRPPAKQTPGTMD